MQQQQQQHQQHQLYHRNINNRQTKQPHQHQQQLISKHNLRSGYHQKKKPSRRNSLNLKHWTILLKYLISTIISISLSIYLFLLLLPKQWPPHLQSPQAEYWISPNLTRADRIMLVVAHPDDESLFFSPTLLNLLSPRPVNQTQSDPSTPHQLNKPAQTNLQSSPRVQILSLSSGNAQGLGIKRTREMRASCWAFGIPSTHCIVLDHPDLPDSMSIWWPEDTIAEFVRLYIDLWNIDTIITFDHHGVSGHANHRAIAAALSRLVHSDPKFPITFMLRSTWILEKYSSLLSLPSTLYRHYRTRKSLLPQLVRPRTHPSRDKKRLAELVLQTLIDLGAANLSSSAPVSSSLPTPTSTNLSLSNLTTPSDVQESLNSSTTSQDSPTDCLPSSHPSLLLSSPSQYWQGRRAFNQHVSQQVWFRRLWLISSRFMWINELIRIVPLESRFSDLPSFNLPTPAEKLIFPLKPKQASPFDHPRHPTSETPPLDHHQPHTPPTPN